MLAIGTKVQSIPGPDEQPHTFETIETIEARPAWNAFRAQLTETQTLAWDMTELWLAGANVTVTVGDLLLIVAPNGSGYDASIRRVTVVESSREADRARVFLATISTSAGSVSASKPGVYVMRSTVSPFGHNAPLQPQYSSGVFQGTFSEWALDGAELDSLLTLSSRNDKILDNSFVVIEQDDPDSGSRMWTFATVTAVTHRSVARYGLAGNGTRLSLSTGWTKNADSKLDLLRTMTVAAQSEEIALAERPLSYPVYGETLSLEQLVEGLAPGASPRGERETSGDPHQASPPCTVQGTEGTDRYAAASSHLAVGRGRVGHAFARRCAADDRRSLEEDRVGVCAHDTGGIWRGLE
jgi:hypothetical protein